MARPKLTLTARQDQRLSMTFLMQQSLKILQMPRLELETFLEHAIETNPLLEKSLEGAEPPPYFEHRATKPPTLYAHLMQQAEQTFSERELQIAATLIGNLDKKGFYSETLSPEERPILKLIQRFDPVGVGAKNPQEALLIQLDEQGKKANPLYRLIEERYDTFLKNKLTPREQAAIKEDLKGLTPFPGLSFDSEPQLPHYPDLILTDEGELNTSLAISFHIHPPSPPK